LVPIITCENISVLSPQYWPDDKPVGRVVCHGGNLTAPVEIRKRPWDRGGIADMLAELAATVVGLLS
jgi:hypothetical protein